jgi:CubicO group peptidase (beta-lactamase class C family)
MLENGGSWDGRRYLAPPTVEALVARHRVGRVDKTFKKKLDWGLGFILDSSHYHEAGSPYGYGPHAGPRTYGRSGARSSTAFADPDARLVVALAVNGMIEEAAHQARFSRATAALYEDLGLVPAVVE